MSHTEKRLQWQLMNHNVIIFFFHFCHLTDFCNVILQGFNHSTPLLTPAEALIAIHKIDPEKDGVPLKKAIILLSAFYALNFSELLVY